MGRPCEAMCRAIRLFHAGAGSGGVVVAVAGHLREGDRAASRARRLISGDWHAPRGAYQAQKSPCRAAWSGGSRALHGMVCEVCLAPPSGGA